MATTTIRVTLNGSPKFLLKANWAQAQSPILVSEPLDSLPPGTKPEFKYYGHQVADFKHNQRAACWYYLAEYLTEGDGLPMPPIPEYLQAAMNTPKFWESGVIK